MAGAQQAEVRPPAQHKKKMKQPTNVAAITYRGGTMASAARYPSTAAIMPALRGISALLLLCHCNGHCVWVLLQTTICCTSHCRWTFDI